MNHLYVCSICQVEIEALAKRRRIEIDTFIKVPGEGGGARESRAPESGELSAVRLCLEDLFCGRPGWPEAWPDIEDFHRRKGDGFSEFRSLCREAAKQLVKE